MNFETHLKLEHVRFVWFQLLRNCFFVLIDFFFQGTLCYLVQNVTWQMIDPLCPSLNISSQECGGGRETGFSNLTCLTCLLFASPALCPPPSHTGSIKTKSVSSEREIAFHLPGQWTYTQLLFESGNNRKVGKICVGPWHDLVSFVEAITSRRGLKKKKSMT